MNLNYPLIITNSLSLDYYIQAFMLKHRSERHSPKTIEYYEGTLSRFSWFLKEADLPTDIGRIRAVEIRAFLSYLGDASPDGKWGTNRANTKKVLSPNSIHSYARALRAFWKWVAREADMQNPFSKVDMPKLSHPWRVEVLTDEEIAQVFSTIDRDADPYLRRRNRLIFSILLDTGLRASEMLAIRVPDVYVGGEIKNTVMVQGKGEKSRMVFLGNFTQKELAAYIPYRLRKKLKNDCLFISSHNKPLTYFGLKEFFTRLKDRSGVEKLHAHILRHTFATKAYRNGMKGVVLQEMLGHASFNTTRSFYINVSEEELGAEHRLYGPLDQMGLENKARKNPHPVEKVEALPSNYILLEEVRSTSYEAVGRKYGYTGAGIKKRLVKSGLL